MTRVLVLAMLVVLEGRATVLNGYKWYEISVAPKEADSEFFLYFGHGLNAVSPGGRVARYSRKNGVVSLWTAMVNRENPGQTRWLKVAEENRGGLTTVWKVSGLGSSSSLGEVNHEAIRSGWGPMSASEELERYR